ncbi:unnamed protein product [Prorocentrum cordatum]|uniref:Uncharacterized protein n=1 Tax=Prorocentrum cordatum TaxID=2364126 RepID=A0ABN9X1M3_9DINO|nr:unnamed protein product [Polarella glacialis]
MKAPLTRPWERAGEAARSRAGTHAAAPLYSQRCTTSLSCRARVLEPPMGPRKIGRWPSPSSERSELVIPARGSGQFVNFETCSALAIAVANGDVGVGRDPSASTLRLWPQAIVWMELANLAEAALAGIRELEKAVQKASPAMLKELSQVDPSKVEQVIRETDPRDLMDFVNRINTGERWLHNWPWLLASAVALALAVFLGVRLMQRMFGRRAKTWANWAPQVQEGTQLSMLGSNASFDAEQPWISVDPSGSA